ncbi:hypothetical protein EVJ58_g7761 [Rhodofomes roseus]|uniref:Transaldolase n=1 Tax=Rhodofomes roseus TaxID=34475 RepID=A0A4Y9Y1U5_9APHY|nr:hypothetical protein EVJ58_g7761 [Rhodofomes roseus]
MSTEPEQELSVEPEDREKPANYTRAASVEPEGGEGYVGPETSVEPGEDEDSEPDEEAERNVRRNYERAASVEPEEHNTPARYRRATTLEPGSLRLTTMHDNLDLPEPLRPAPPRPKYRVKDFINVRDTRKIPPSIYQAVLKAREEEAREGGSQSVWLQRVALHSAGLPTLLEGLRQRGISVVGRTTRVGALDERMHDATMLDAPTMYKMTKRGFVDEALLLTIEYVVNESPNIRDRATLRHMVLERFLVDMGASIAGRSRTGLHFTYLSPALMGNTELMVEQALRLVKLFAEKHDIATDRLVISIPATTSGMYAAKCLRHDHGIRTNLTLVSSVMHAAVCLETGTNIISIDHEKWFHGLKSWAARTESTAGNATRDSIWRDVWAVGAAPREIRAICTLLKQHSPSTQLLVSNMRQIDDLAFLPDIHGVVLKTTELEGAKLLRLPFHANPDPEAVAKAQEIRFPTSYLSDEEASLTSLPQSEKDHHVSRFIVSNEAQQLLAYQRQLEEKVEEVLAYRLWIRDLDPLELERMYQEDIYAEDARQLEEEYLNLINSPKKVEGPSPRTNHVGYRMAKTTWDVAFKARSVDEDARVRERSDRLQHVSMHTGFPQRT